MLTPDKQYNQQEALKEQTNPLLSQDYSAQQCTKI